MTAGREQSLAAQSPASSRGQSDTPQSLAPSREQSLAAFYFDLASPLAYLAAERVLHVLPMAAEWQPVLAGESIELASFDSAEIERRAHAQGLQPIRWPEDYPFDSERAMLVATYAKSIGRAVPFAQAAFRQAFAGARSLAVMDNLLIAAAACEMHPRAVLKSATLNSVAEQLASTTAMAARAGVTDLPAVRIGAHVCSGEDAVEHAAKHARALSTAIASAPLGADSR